MDKLGHGLVSTRSGPSHAFTVPLVVPQEFLAEHVVEGGLGEDLDSRALEGQFFGLFLLVALAVFDARAVVVVAENQIASRLGDAILVDAAQVRDDLHGFGAREFLELAREDAGTSEDRAVLIDFLGVALNVSGLDGVTAADYTERLPKLFFAAVTFESFGFQTREALGGCLDVAHGAVNLIVGDTEMVDEVCQAVVGHLRVQLACNTQGVDVVAGERPVQVAVEGIVEEVDVEADAVADDGHIPDEGCELREHVGSKGRTCEHLVGNTRQRRDEVVDEVPARHARRLDQRGEPPDLLAVRDFECRDFDDVVPLGAAPRGLDVDHAVRVRKGGDAASLRFADRLRARQGLQVRIWHENSFVRASIALLRNPIDNSNESTRRTRRREAIRGQVCSGTVC